MRFRRRRLPCLDKKLHEPRLVRRLKQLLLRVQKQMPKWKRMHNSQELHRKSHRHARNALLRIRRKTTLHAFLDHVLGPFLQHHLPAQKRHQKTDPRRKARKEHIQHSRSHHSLKRSPADLQRPLPFQPCNIHLGLRVLPPTQHRLQSRRKIYALCHNRTDPRLRTHRPPDRCDQQNLPDKVT